MRHKIMQKLRPRGSNNEAHNGAEIVPKRKRKQGPKWGRNKAQEEANMRPEMGQKLSPRGSEHEAHNWTEVAPKRKQK